MFGHGQPRIPGAARLEVWLELGHAVPLGGLYLLVWVEGGGVGGDVDGVRAVEVGGAEGDGRCVSDAYVEEVRGGQYAVVGRRVGHRVPATGSVPAA